MWRCLLSKRSEDRTRVVEYCFSAFLIFHADTGTAYARTDAMAIIEYLGKICLALAIISEIAPPIQVQYPGRIRNVLMRITNVLDPKLDANS